MIEKRSSMMKRKVFLPEGDIPNDGFSKLYRDPTVAGNCVAVVFLNSATVSVTLIFLLVLLLLVCFPFFCYFFP